MHNLAFGLQQRNAPLTEHLTSSSSLAIHLFFLSFDASVMKSTPPNHFRILLSCPLDPLPVVPLPLDLRPEVLLTNQSMLFCFAVPLSQLFFFIFMLLLFFYNSFAFVFHYAFPLFCFSIFFLLFLYEIL